MASLCCLLGCAGGDEPKTFCQAFCAAVHECREQAPYCADACNASDYAKSLSPDGSHFLGECVTGMDCSSLLDGTGEPWAECWHEAAARVPLRQKLRTFCASWSAALLECGEAYSRSDCEHGFGVWSDAKLDELLACMNQSCQDAQTCLKHVTGAA